ncbi:MAG: low molecular weight protein-tyrosine-phosphatase [Roseovarius sp.]
MTSRILFVCLGNICRSPAAEGVFRVLAPGIETDSCGTGGWHVGEPPYPPMQAAARARGYDISDLRARRLRAEDFERFDLILAMDRDNLRDIEALRPPGNRTPARLFADFLPTEGAGGSALGLRDVPDPYFTRDFDAALDIIEAGARGLKAALDAGR